MALPSKPFLIFSISLVATLAAPASAADVGSVDKGRVYAERACAGCHDLNPMALSTPPGRPASFRMIADTPGMSALALEVWFRTPHPTMPNLMVPQEERENVIAFLLSLKNRPQL